MGVFRRGDKYYIDFRVNGARKTRLVGPSKREAQDALGKIRAELREGRFFDKKRLTPTALADLVKRYAGLMDSRRGWETERVHLDVILGYFGKDRMAHHITRADVEAFQAKRKKTKTVHGRARSNATVNREVQVLQRLLNKAIDWDMATSNPVDGVTYLEESAGRTRFLSMEEARALLGIASGGILYPVLVCALSTGMRKDEILGLRWSEVDLSNRLIFLSGDRTKTGRSRYVPINTALAAALSELPRDREYVFFPRRVRSIKKSWATLCRKAGVEFMHFHDLRHTAVSYMVMAGASLKAAGEVVGHSDTTMTARYTHLTNDFTRKAVEALPRWEEKDASSNDA